MNWSLNTTGLKTTDLKKTSLAIVVVLSLSTAGVCGINIETVPVGNPGNTDDNHGDGYGGVNYAFDMGKFEVTAGQYCEFLNDVAKTDPYGLYNSNMGNYTYGCQITRSGGLGSYYYSFSGTESEWENRPVNYVSWLDAARFVNWMQSGNTEYGAYDLSSLQDAYGSDGTIDTVKLMNGLAGVIRSANATWVIPSEDEWYKAAYHKKGHGINGGYFDYPTASDDVPSNDLDGGGNNATIIDNGDYTIGHPYYRTKRGAHTNSPSPYGTFDQGGNVWEWNEDVIAGSNRGLRGGTFDSAGVELAAWNRNSYSPIGESYKVGFRVARVSQVPEPSSLILWLCGLVIFACWRRWK